MGIAYRNPVRGDSSDPAPSYLEGADIQPKSLAKPVYSTAETIAAAKAAAAAAAVPTGGVVVPGVTSPPAAPSRPTAIVAPPLQPTREKMTYVTTSTGAFAPSLPGTTGAGYPSSGPSIKDQLLGAAIQIGGAYVTKRLGLTGGGGAASSEPASGSAVVPGNFSGAAAGQCGPGKIRFGDSCIDPLALPPGGKPALTGAQAADVGYGDAVYGRYGLGLVPAQEVRTVRKCPKGMVLGDDGVCYEHLPKRDRMWNPGDRPLLTGGEMAAIRKAASAAKRLQTTRKRLKKTTKALEKASC